MKMVYCVNNKVKSVFFLVVLISIIFGLIILFNNERLFAFNILIPILFNSIVFIFFIKLGYSKSKKDPLFDLGFYMALFIFIYSAIPSLQFILSDFSFTILSARQLFILSPSVEEYAAFSWLYSLYLLSFVTIYSICKKKDFYSKNLNPHASNLDLFILLIISIPMVIFFEYLKIFYGVDSSVSYRPDLLYEQYSNYLNLPGTLKQFYGHLLNLFFILKVAFFSYCILNWNKKLIRNLLIIYIIYLIIDYLIISGSRLNIMLSFFVIFILYNRFVSKITIFKTLIYGLVALFIFLFLGIFRVTGSIYNFLFNPDIATGDSKLFLGNMSDLFSMANEFQVLFAGAYDIYRMVNLGELNTIPWQLNWIELIMLIPNQFLPFEKLDPGQWYIETTKVGGDFMLNPIAQGAIGFGVFEIILRGAFLGIVLSFITNVYNSNKSKFLYLVFYVWSISQAYYSIRSSTFYFFTFILYSYVPFICAYIFLRYIIYVFCTRKI